MGGGPDVAGSRRGGFNVPTTRPDRILKKPPVNIYETVFEAGRPKKYPVDQYKGHF